MREQDGWTLTKGPLEEYFTMELAYISADPSPRGGSGMAPHK